MTDLLFDIIQLSENCNKTFVVYSLAGCPAECQLEISVLVLYDFPRLYLSIRITDRQGRSDRRACVFVHKASYLMRSTEYGPRASADTKTGCVHLFCRRAQINLDQGD